MYKCVYYLFVYFGYLSFLEFTPYFRFAIDTRLCATFVNRNSAGYGPRNMMRNVMCIQYGTG